MRARVGDRGARRNAYDLPAIVVLTQLNVPPTVWSFNPRRTTQAGIVEVKTDPSGESFGDIETAAQPPRHAFVSVESRLNEIVLTPSCRYNSIDTRLHPYDEAET